MNAVKEAYVKGFDVIVINHRGLAGCPLTTPKLYHGGSTDDFREPLKQIHDIYCKTTGKKIMALGCSLGANKLALVLG